MLGYCTYNKNLSVKNCIYSNKSIAIWDNNANYCYREGCFLAFTGKIYNINKLKEEKQIKDLFCENILMTLFLEMGEKFVVHLDGSFIIVIYDEINKFLHIFTDRNCIKTVYLAKINEGFIFTDNLKYILEDPDFQPKMDTNCILNIFALPYAYLGEPFRNLYKISGDEYVTVSYNGAEFFAIEREIEAVKPSEFKFCLPQAGDLYINCLLNQGKITTILLPHIIKDAVNQRCITNSHLFFLQKCGSYPELMNEKYDFDSYINNYCCNLLSNLAPFNYKTEKDIEDAEKLFINYNLYYKPCLTQVNCLCEAYGVENNSNLLNPECLKWIYLNKRNKFPLFNSDVLYLTQDVRETTSALCQNHTEPIFKIINRHRLYNSCADAEASFLLFIQRMNNFLKKFRPEIEFF